MKRAATAPKIVGTLSSVKTLRACAALPRTRRAADIVEVRLDALPLNQHAECFRLSRRLESTGTQVLMTLRECRAVKNDAQRLDIYEKALAVATYADVDHDSPVARGVAKAVRRLGRRVVVSYHNFAKTPPLAELRKQARRCLARGADVVKIATMVNRVEDHATLAGLLREGCAKPLCVIGMGALGVSLRVYLPAVGSCFAYGYLDKAMAPGQLPCALLSDILRETCPAYR